MKLMLRKESLLILYFKMLDINSGGKTYFLLTWLNTGTIYDCKEKQIIKIRSNKIDWCIKYTLNNDY